jgi:putative transposase
MATSALQIKRPIVDEQRLGGLSERERYEVYERAGYNPFQITQLEWMVAESGQRPVGKGALQNVKVQLASAKCGAIRVLESHTCERPFAYELEMDGTVQGYYSQFPCRHVLRTGEGGTKHVSNATLDFLVFHQDRVELIECKPERWLEKNQRPGEWEKNGEGWTCRPYERWANERDFPFRVWTPPEPVANYLRNLEAMYALKQLPLGPDEMRIAERSLALLEDRPYSIEELGDAVPGFRERIALVLLADRRCYGLVTSTPITSPQHFYLYSTWEQARQVDASAFQALVRATSQPVVHDAIGFATTTDYNAAKRRLARLERIQRGVEKPTVRMKQLASRVKKAVLEGSSPLTACLTSYAKSGNRQARLDPTQQQCLEWVIRVLWNRGKVRTLKNLWFELEKVCNLHHAATPSIETLYRYVRQEDATKRALATGGMRAYQAARPISDPTVRSGKAIGFGHTLHIDSSQFDNRCEPIVEIDFCGDKPWFYIGIDEATGLPMAHSLYFGKACTNGLALLLRDFVRRHGFLPLVIVLDRGSENDSIWLKAFCLENGITLLWAPTGGSRYNGQAECAIKQVNINVAHDLPGSTAPDMKGRKVDGKFKSRKTAKLAFMTICRAFEEYLYDDLPNTPGEGDCTPVERRDEAVGRFGVMGTPQQLDDDFQIKTSVPVDFKGKATEKRGIQTGRGIFTSEELRFLLRTSQPDEVRQDCEDSMLLFVRVRSQWLKAYHSGIFSTASLRPLEKLFEFLWSPHARRGRRLRKLDVDRPRYHRNQAHAVAVGPEQSSPEKQDKDAEVAMAEVSDSDANPGVCWDNYSPLPEE